MKKNKVALITGGVRGIGASISRRLKNDGYFVVATSREAISYEFADLTFRLNFHDEQSISDFIDSISGKITQLDVLINNAGGVTNKNQFYDLDIQDWYQSFELNLMSIVRMVQGLDNFFVSGSRIINIASLTALQPGNFNPHYSSIKASVLNITKYLANLLACRNILVNAISPGVVFTESITETLKANSSQHNTSYQDEYEGFVEDELKKTRLSRLGDPEDISALVSFLTSGESSWITGANFIIDGGKFQSAF